MRHMIEVLINGEQYHLHWLRVTPKKRNTLIEMSSGHEARRFKIKGTVEIDVLGERDERCVVVGP